MKAKHHTNFLPDRVFSYFQKEWKVLLAVTISGLIYNIGLLAGPWFEGKMTGWKNVETGEVLAGGVQPLTRLAAALADIRANKVKYLDEYRRLNP